MTTTYKDKLSPEEIQRPKATFVERFVGSHIREYARRKTDEAIREHATLPDGRIDQELAEYIDKKLTQSTAINTRYVMGAGSWVITLTAGARALGEAYSNHKNNGHFYGESKGKFAAVTSVTVLAAMAIDAFRMNRHFNGAFQGELDGALASIRKQRVIERALSQESEPPKANAGVPQPQSNWQEVALQQPPMQKIPSGPGR